MSNLIQGGISHYSVEEHIKYSGLSDLAISVIEMTIEENMPEESDENLQDEIDDLEERVGELETEVEEAQDEIEQLKGNIHKLEIALEVANNTLTRYQNFTKTVMNRTINGSYFITYELPFGLHIQIKNALVENDLDFT